MFHGFFLAVFRRFQRKRQIAVPLHVGAQPSHIPAEQGINHHAHVHGMRQPPANAGVFQKLVRTVQVQAVRGAGITGFQAVLVYVAPVHFRQFQPVFPHFRLADVHHVQLPAAEHFNRLVFQVYKYMLHLVRIAGIAVVFPVLRPPVLHAGQGDALAYPYFTGNHHVAPRIRRNLPLVAFQKQGVEIMVKTGMGRMEIHAGHVRQQRPG